MIPKSTSYHELIEDIFPDLCKDRRVRFITFQVTEDCNLRCKYCYQHAKTHHKMSFEMAKEFVDLLLNEGVPYVTTANTAGVVFEFIGGEPFMEIGLIRQITNYIKEEMVKKNHPWKHF